MRLGTAKAESMLLIIYLPYFDISCIILDVIQENQNQKKAIAELNDIININISNIMYILEDHSQALVR